MFSVRQSDGTYLKVRGFGDANFHYYITSDGVLLCHEGTDYFIANVNANGELSSSGLLAHNADMRSETERILAESQDREAFHAMNSRLAMKKARREPLTENSTLFPHSGNPKAVVLLVDFPDVPFTVSSPATVFDKYLNATDLFTPEGDPDMMSVLGINYGSVKRYFTDMSFGQFSPEFDIYGPYRLPSKLKTYGAGRSDNMTTLFRDAMTLADADVDFSEYDSNNDGKIDLIYIIYAGFSESISGNSSDCIWPKSGTVSLSTKFDGKSISRYGVNNELYGNPEVSEIYGVLINGIGLFCHEFSHCLGLPDLYASEGSEAEKAVNQTPDYWDIMDTGEYANNSYTPVAYTAWERERFGWMTIDTLETAQDVELLPIDENGKAYRILNDADENKSEYYIVENVQKRGWNKNMYGHGMLVWHIDYRASSFGVGGTVVNQTLGHPRMMIIPADGLAVSSFYRDETITSSMPEELYKRYGGNTFTTDLFLAEYAGDPFPGSTNVVAFTDSTDVKSWTFRGTGFMGKPITDIRESESGAVTFKFMGGTPTEIKGDVNGDGIVNGTDLTTLVNIILGQRDETNAADVNDDGIVNGTDLTILVNIIMS